MIIETYSGKYDEDIISLILSIQNYETKIDLSLEEQPDLLNIAQSYQKDGGEFWVARSDGKVIGTIGLMLKEKNCAVMKKFFVKKEFRSKKVGLALYKKLLEFAKEKKVKYIILDTPGAAKTSHRFYEKAGFYKIDKTQLPVPYSFPDRESILYMLDLSKKMGMKIKKLEYDFSVCKVEDYSFVNRDTEFCFTAKTDEENSLVCLTKDVPPNATERDDGWRTFRIQGTLDFSLIGILSEISGILADNKIGIFAVSTYNTDYILTKTENFERAIQVLFDAGYEIVL